MNPDDERAKKGRSQQLSANGAPQNSTKQKARQKVFEDQGRKSRLKLNEVHQNKVKQEWAAKDAEFYRKRRQDLDNRKKAAKEQGATKTRLDPMRAQRLQRFEQQSKGATKTIEKKRERER